MRRTILVASVVLLALGMLAPSASAEQVTHLKQSSSWTYTSRRGETCKFAVKENFTEEVNLILFGDPDNPTRAQAEVHLDGTHTNLKTGYSVTEDDVIVNLWMPGMDRWMYVGLQWNVRTLDGEPLYIRGGQIVLDVLTGEVVSVTPSLGPSVSEVLCPLLDH